MTGYNARMDKFFSYIPGMMDQIGNHIDFPNYISVNLVKVTRVIARDLEYGIAKTT